MNFTIKKIKSDGSVDVSFSDGVVQNISGLPISDEVSLTKALIEYGQAYLSGKQIEAQSVDVSEVKALEGKKVDVEAFLVEQAVVAPVEEIVAPVEPVVEATETVEPVAEAPVEAETVVVENA